MNQALQVKVAVRLLLGAECLIIQLTFQVVQVTDLPPLLQDVLEYFQENAFRLLPHVDEAGVI